MYKTALNGPAPCVPCPSSGLWGWGHPIHIFLVFPGNLEFWTPLQIPIWGPLFGCTLLQSHHFSICDWIVFCEEIVQDDPNILFLIKPFSLILVTSDDSWHHDGCQMVVFKVHPLFYIIRWHTAVRRSFCFFLIHSFTHLFTSVWTYGQWISTCYNHYYDNQIVPVWALSSSVPCPLATSPSFFEHFLIFCYSWVF